MSEYCLTYFHIGKYRKEAKMHARMTKELRKAARAKFKEVMSTITNERVFFEGKKEEIIRADIAVMRRNREYRVIVVAVTKVGNKHPGQIFAMRFSNDDDFYRFFDILSEPPRDEKVRRPAPTASVPSSDWARVPSTTPSRSAGRSRNLSSVALLSKSTDACFDSISSTTPSQAICAPALQTPTQNQPYSRSSFPQIPCALMSPRSMSAATYVTTDTLPSYMRYSTPRGRDKVSARNAHPMKEKTIRRKDKNHTEMNFLTYVPCKGMVKSTEGNVYLYSKAKPNAFTSTSPSSSLSTSSSTPAMDPLKEAQLFRIVETIRTSSESSSSSSIRSSRRSSNASPSSSIERANRVNVWKYQNRRASTSTSSSTSTDTTTPDERIGRRRSGPGSAEYVRCPTCHRRCWLLVFRQ